MMAISDRTLGYIQLTFGCGMLLYLFFHLIIWPILPVDHNPLEKYTPTTMILSICGIFGFIFIGFLSLFTIIVIYKFKSRFK